MSTKPNQPGKPGAVKAVVGLIILVAVIIAVVKSLAGGSDTPAASPAPTAPASASHAWTFKVESNGAPVQHVVFTKPGVKVETVDNPGGNTWETTVDGDYGTTPPSLTGQIYGIGMITVTILRDGAEVATGTKGTAQADKNPVSYVTVNAPKS